MAYDLEEHLIKMVLDTVENGILVVSSRVVPVMDVWEGWAVKRN